MLKTKKDWFEEFRKQADKYYQEIATTGKTKKVKSNYINTNITNFRAECLKKVNEQAQKDKWNNETILNEVLMVTYVSYVVMLEYRNKVWPYEYMAFARRNGEMWEPFCKLTFEYPVKSLKLIEPADFEVEENKWKKSAKDKIDSLDVSAEDKIELKKGVDIPWYIIDSGEIQLGLDLHFEQDGVKYHCDYKSGFGSNEKGNTNRLLTVASVYRLLGKNNKTLIFVRQRENNHYLLRLKNSNLWEVYCADAAYAAMQTFTGFDLRKWIDENAKWLDDMSDDLKRHLIQNGLDKYLTW